MVTWTLHNIMLYYIAGLVFVVFCADGAFYDELNSRSEESNWVCVSNCLWSTNLRNEAT
jgi:RsiW-degrading membrane proteinase PrsW (M82 family)